MGISKGVSAFLTPLLRFFSVLAGIAWIPIATLWFGYGFGAIVFVIANYLLSDMNPQYWQFWLGLILVLVVLFARGGILGTARLWIESSRQRAQSRARTESPS